MGVFPSTYFPHITQISTMNMIFSTTSDMSKGKEIDEKPYLSPPKALYHAIQSAYDAYVNDHHLVASDPYHIPYWLDSSIPTLNYLLHTFPLDEFNMEIMNSDESLWEDHHHKSYFLPNDNSIELYFVSLISFDIVEYPHSLVLLQGVDSKGNLCNITYTIPIDISVKTRTIEHVHVGQYCSTTEIEIYQALFKEF